MSDTPARQAAELPPEGNLEGPPEVPPEVPPEGNLGGRSVAAAGRSRTGRGASVGAVATGIAAVLVIVLPAVVPSQDLPTHLAAVALRLDPASGGGLIEPNLPITGGLFHFTASALGLAVGVDMGARLALLLWGAVGTWGAWRLGRSVGGSGAVVSAVFAAGWVGWLLAMGFVNFLAAFALGLAATGLLSGGGAGSAGQHARPSRGLLGAALAMGAVFGHVLGGGMALAVGAVGIVAEPGHRPPLRRLASLAPAALAGAVLMAVSFVAGRDARTVETLQASVRLGIDDWVRDLVATPFVSFGAVGFALPPILAIGAAVRRSRTGEGRPLLATAVGWLVLYAVLPLHGFGLAFAGPRVTLALCLVLAAAVDTSRRWVPAVVTWVCFATVASAVPGAVRWGEHLAELRDAFGPPQPGFQFAVLLDDGRRPLAPHANLYVGLSEYGGGVGSAAFAVNRVRDASLLTELGRAERPRGPLFAVWPACSAVVVDCDAHERTVARSVALQAIRWDTVLAIGAGPTFSQELVARGYAPLAPARWVPRPATLHVRIDTENSEPLVAQVVAPDTGPMAQSHVRDGRATLGPLLAGPARLVIGTPEGQVRFQSDIDVEAGREWTLTIAGVAQ